MKIIFKECFLGLCLSILIINIFIFNDFLLDALIDFRYVEF